MLIARIAALIITVAVAAPALAQNVTTEHDETVDFSKFKTFAIREGEIKTKTPALSSELTRKRLETEIEKALSAKGLKKASGPADLNVFYGLGATRGTDTEAYPAGFRGRATRIVKVSNAEGTLIIDMRDPSTRALVWRAIATEDEPNPSKLAEKLDDMVKKAIQKYPPRK